MPKLDYAILLVAFATVWAQEPRARQTADKVTLAVEAYDSGEKVKQTFGKTDPAKLGVVPVLVVVINGSDRALQLSKMRVQLITSDGQTVDAVPPEDVLRTGRVTAPDLGKGPGLPGIGRGRRAKEEPMISAKAFVAPAVQAGDRAQGFFYFRIVKNRIPGSKVYIRGIRDARTGQELLYFEINLDAKGG
ncbi:MAG: hypothetical protein HY238_27235 [Acidobacteria bacterium]|nr:hypothetical protein [Acidobacteriota bacterium]